MEDTTPRSRPVGSASPAFDAFVSVISRSVYHVGSLLAASFAEYGPRTARSTCRLAVGNLACLADWMRTASKSVLESALVSHDARPGREHGFPAAAGPFQRRPRRAAAVRRRSSAAPPRHRRRPARRVPDLALQTEDFRRTARHPCRKASRSDMPAAISLDSVRGRSCCGLAPDMAAVLVGGYGIGQQPVGDGRLCDREAEGSHAMAYIVEYAPFPGVADTGPDPSVLHHALGKIVEAVGDHVSGTRSSGNWSSRDQSLDRRVPTRSGLPVRSEACQRPVHDLPGRGGIAGARICRDAPYGVSSGFDGRNAGLHVCSIQVRGSTHRDEILRESRG